MPPRGIPQFYRQKLEGNFFLLLLLLSTLIKDVFVFREIFFFILTDHSSRIYSGASTEIDVFS